MMWLALILWALPAIWLVWGIIAPTRTGAKAQHSIWCIYRPVGPINPDGSTTVFSHVHEKGEWRLSKMLAKLTGLLFPIAITLVPVDPVLTLLMLIVQCGSMIVVDNKTRSLAAVDYAGHGAEIMAAEADSAFGYREAEIGRLARNADKRGDDIPAMLDRWRWLARVVYFLGRW